jgi:hypothetical protein
MDIVNWLKCQIKKLKSRLVLVENRVTVLETSGTGGGGPHTHTLNTLFNDAFGVSLNVYGNSPANFN